MATTLYTGVNVNKILVNEEDSESLYNIEKHWSWDLQSAPIRSLCIYHFRDKHGECSADRENVPFTICRYKTPY